jgi:NitT/TauT family transport system substrate-binding protein
MTTGGRQPLRLMETWRSIFYTPIYVSVAGGFLEREGLDVTFSTCPSQFSHPLSALHHDAADIVQSGIMRSIIASDWGAETVPLHFAKINSRDGFFILGREPQDEFDWETLRGAKVIPVGFSPMPWASFQFALRRHGLEPSDLDLRTGLSLPDAVAAFRSGEAEYVHVAEPIVQQLIADQAGHLLTALGPENGHLAYSSFAATHRFLAEREETVGRFTVGFARALHWLSSAESDEAAETVAEFFPQTSQDVLSASIARYQQQEQWPVNPILREPEFDSLHDILLAAGMCRERQPYEKIVTTDVAEAAVASL